MVQMEQLENQQQDSRLKLNHIDEYIKYKWPKNFN